MANVWGYWICPACGGLVRGDKRNCPGCETPIPAGIKYLPPNDPKVRKAFEENGGEALEYVPVEQERKRPNWICQYCGSQNFDESQTCAGCGMPRFGAKEDYFGNEINLTEEEKTDRELTGMDGPKEEESVPESTSEPVSESTSEPVSGPLPVRTEPARIAESTPLPRRPRWPLVLFVLFLIWCVFPVKQNLVVEGFEWRREIAIEEYQLCHESDWSLPAGAELTEKKSEIHHYNRVLDHYEKKTKKVAHRVQDGYSTSYKDLGNGQYKEVKTPKYRTEYKTETYKEPVYKNVPAYQTKYYYDIGRWKRVTETAVRGESKDPTWPECNLPSNVSNPAYGDRRQGARTEEYKIHFKTKKGKTETRSYSFAEWKKMQVGDVIVRRKARFATWFQ